MAWLQLACESLWDRLTPVSIGCGTITYDEFKERKKAKLDNKGKYGL